MTAPVGEARQALVCASKTTTAPIAGSLTGDQITECHGHYQVNAGADRT